MMEYRLRKHITASRAARISRGRSALPARYIARTHVESHTVLRIEAAEPEAVYCLATPAHGAFALANGVVVANCLDAGGYFITYKFPIQRRTAIVTPLRM